MYRKFVEIVRSFLGCVGTPQDARVIRIMILVLTIVVKNLSATLEAVYIE